MMFKNPRIRLFIFFLLAITAVVCLPLAGRALRTSPGDGELTPAPVSTKGLPGVNSMDGRAACPLEGELVVPGEEVQPGGDGGGAAQVEAGGDVGEIEGEREGDGTEEKGEAGDSRDKEEKGAETGSVRPGPGPEGEMTGGPAGEGIPGSPGDSRAPEGPPGGVSPGGEKDRERELAETLSRALSYYQERQDRLDSWWQVVALFGAGKNPGRGPWALPVWGAADLAEGDAAVAYARFVLGMLARGQDPSSPGEAWENRDLVRELQDRQQPDGGFGGTVNNTIWAIIALEATGGQYDRDRALDYLLGQQKADGGFALAGNSGDPDMTGMALVALSYFQGSSRGKESLGKGISFLERAQLDTGGFASYGIDNSNSLAVVISGLVAAGEDIWADKWMKGEVCLLQALQRFQLEDGSFSYLLEPRGFNSMATEQALVALGDLRAGQAAWKRLKGRQ